MSSSKSPFYVAPNIKEQLLRGKEKVMGADQDRVYVVTGREGLGKSTLAMQLASTVDPDLSLDNIVFTSKQFEDRIRKLGKGKAIIFDEAFNGLSSKGAISKENKKLVRLLMECRARNLFIFIVLPSFFLLEKYVALFRSTALFNVLVSRKNFKRRFYKVYNYSDKRLLYILGRNLMDYSKPKIPYSSRFYGKLPPSINKEEYEAKKKAAFRNKEEKEDDTSKQVLQRTALSHLLKTKYGVSYAEQARYLKSAGSPVADTVLSRYAKDVPQKIQNT